MSFDSRQNKRNFAFRHFGEVVLLCYDLDLYALILVSASTTLKAARRPHRSSRDLEGDEAQDFQHMTKAARFRTNTKALDGFMQKIAFGADCEAGFEAIQCPAWSELMAGLRQKAWRSVLGVCVRADNRCLISQIARLRLEPIGIGEVPTMWELQCRRRDNPPIVDHRRRVTPSAQPRLRACSSCPSLCRACTSFLGAKTWMAGQADQARP